jgi:prepilin-type N-terminal cleavage/methylation domain-containing protein
MKKPTVHAQGFTLIELLVVIAIIGILAAMVAVGMSGAENKGRDSRLKSDIHQIANIAELVKNDDDSYGDLCTSSSALNSDHSTQGSALGVLQTDVNTLNATLTCATGTSQYCVSIELLSSGAGHFCIDSTGLATTTSSSDCTTSDADCSD